MINLTAVIDNDEAVRKLHELQRVAKTTTSSVVEDSERMDASWQQMKSSLMSLTAGVSFAALAKQVVQVRGEVQQLEVAFETMLGSKSKADILMTDIIDLAAKTPFGLQDVSNATKMLLAYGSTAEEVTDEIKMLGNIASGLSIPLNDLIFLYGTTRTQGRMFTMDLRQFMGRGIPLAEELAKQFGVTKDEVGALVTAGKVGFDDMARALQAMSSEGGKFNNLMDKQSATITGQISNLEDSIYQMFNEIGKSSEGVISDLISGASWVVSHYQEILNVLKYVIAAYGAYRAALILVAGAQKALALAEAAAGMMRMAKAASGLAVAMRALTAATGPIGLIVSILGVAVTAFTSFNNKSKEATEQMGQLEQAAYDEYIEVNRLVGRLQDATLEEGERKKVLDKLKTLAPDIVDGIRDEANMTAQLTANLKDYNTEQIRKIQLAGLDDKMRGEMEKVGGARTQFASARVDWSNMIAEYNAKRLADWTPSATYTSELKGSGVRFSLNDRQKAQVEAEVVAALDKILRDANTTDTYKAQAVSDYLSKTHTFGGIQYKVSGIDGFDVKGAIAAMDDARENVRQAEAAFNEFAKEDKQLRDIIGGTAGDKKEEAEATLTFAETYASLEEAYNKAYDKVADIKRNKDKYSTEEAKAAMEDLDAAEKAFKEVGGVPKNKAQQSAQKTAKEQEKAAKDIKDRSVRLEREAQQAVIDAMTEGTDKKIAQIELDYQRREDEIATQEEELKKLQGGKLTDEQNTQLANLRKGAANDYANALNEAIFGKDDGSDLKAILDKHKAEAKAKDEYYIMFGTHKEKVLATTRKYNQLIAEAETEGQRMALEAERDAILAQFEVEASAWAKELVGKTTEQLNTMLDELEKTVAEKEQAFQALDNSQGDDAKTLRDKINELNAQIAILKKRLGEADDAVANDNWADATQVFQSVAKSAAEAAQSIAEFDERLGFALNGIAQLASLSVDVIGALQGVKKAFEKTGEAASAMEKASAILAVISVAIKAVSAIFNVMKDNEEATRNATLAAYEYAQALERIRNEELRGSFSTIFGKDEYGEMLALLDKSKAQLQEIEKQRRELAKTTENAVDNLGRSGSAWANFGGLKDTMNEGYNYDEALVADMRSGWQKFWGSGNDNIKYTSLDEFYEDGKLNVDKLKAYYDTYKEYLTEEQADLVKSLIDTGELYEENMQAISDYMSGIFGELGGSIADSLVSAFESGTDAAEAMGDAFSEVIEQMARDMVLATFIQPLLEEAQKSIDDLTKKKGDGKMTDEEYMAGLMDIGASLVDGALAQQESANAFLGALDKRMAELGYENAFDGGSDLSATSKGFQAMSQDTGDELNGRFTDIQGKVTGIHEAVQFIKSQNLEQMQHTQSISQTVALIHNDTQLIERHTRVLGQISEDIARIKSNTENI